MDKETVPILTVIVILFIGGFFYYTTQMKKDNTSAIPEASVTENYSTNNDSADPNNINSTTTMPKASSKAPNELTIDTSKQYTAVLETTEGPIKINLNVKDTPITSNNFITLARKGFYNNTVFHRVIKGFMIQGGDPDGDGTGGPGYQFDDEPFKGEYTRGTIAMANAGPNTNGSQFFIMHKDYPLPKNYVIFGKVTEGIETVDKIAETEVTESPSGEASSPVDPIIVQTVEIIEQ